MLLKIRTYLAVQSKSINKIKLSLRLDAQPIYNFYFLKILK